MGKNLLVLDSGALTELAGHGHGIRRVIDNAVARGVNLIVPSAVIAEATTGDHRRDANANRELKRARVVALDEPIARAAAVLRHTYRKAGAGTIDAIVVATADAVPGAQILTADPTDLTLLASVKAVTEVVSVADAR